jgi:hypothetical protein
VNPDSGSVLRETNDGAIRLSRTGDEVARLETERLPSGRFRRYTALEDPRRGAEVIRLLASSRRFGSKIARLGRGGAHVRITFSDSTRATLSAGSPPPLIFYDDNTRYGQHSLFPENADLCRRLQAVADSVANERESHGRARRSR